MVSLKALSEVTDKFVDQAGRQLMSYRDKQHEQQKFHEARLGRLQLERQRTYEQRINFRAASTAPILNLMSADPDITIVTLSQHVGINIAAVNKQIKQLTDKGYVERASKGEGRLIIAASI